MSPFFSFGDDFSANSLISNSRTSCYFCLIDGLYHKTGVVLYWSFMVPDINSRRFSFFPSFHAKRRKAGVTGRQRPCAGSGGESLRARKRARSGGSMPPGGERSVCGMSGRHNAAVPLIFVENLSIPHGDSSAPRMVVSGLTQCKPQASH